MNGVNWEFVIGIAVTIGLAIVGGVWALVHFVGKLGVKAGELIGAVNGVVPRVAAVEENVDELRDSHEDLKARVDVQNEKTSKLEGEVEKLRTSSHELAIAQASGGKR